MKKLLSFCCVLALMVSCEAHYLSTNDFDKSCQVAEDCVLVREQDMCYHSCEGKFAAINVQEMPSFGQKKQDLREGCIDFMTVECDYFLSPVVICADGWCNVDESRDSREDAGSAD
jgi:hypothetical protein